MLFAITPVMPKRKVYFLVMKLKRQELLNNAIQTGEIRSDLKTTLIASNLFSINMGLAGNLLRNNSVDDAILTERAKPRVLQTIEKAIKFSAKFGGYWF